MLKPFHKEVRKIRFFDGIEGSDAKLDVVKIWDIPASRLPALLTKSSASSETNN